MLATTHKYTSAPSLLLALAALAIVGFVSIRTFEGVNKHNPVTRAKVLMPAEEVVTESQLRAELPKAYKEFGKGDNAAWTRYGYRDALYKRPGGFQSPAEREAAMLVLKGD